MIAKLCDLQRKELVNVKDGTKIGYVDDAIIDIDTAMVKSLVVYVQQLLTILKILQVSV
jgi:sporulation protein YlmC with PRC-barrel domain